MGIIRGVRMSNVYSNGCIWYGSCNSISRSVFLSSPTHYSLLTTHYAVTVQRTLVRVCLYLQTCVAQLCKHNLHLSYLSVNAAESAPHWHSGSSVKMCVWLRIHSNNYTLVYICSSHTCLFYDVQCQHRKELLSRPGKGRSLATWQSICIPLTSHFTFLV